VTRDELLRKKAKALKKVVSYYRNVVRKVLGRSEKILERWPDSRTAAENKEDCEAALRAEKKAYRELQGAVTELPEGQLMLEDLDID
jgi:hypothetical protein